jgi:hypothetical protein
MTYGEMMFFIKSKNLSKIITEQSKNISKNTFLKKDPFKYQSKNVFKHFYTKITDWQRTTSKKTVDFLFSHHEKPQDLSKGIPTVLEHALQKLPELQQLFTAFGTDQYEKSYRTLAKLVVFNPERTTLHEIMKMLICSARIANEDDLIHQTLKIYKMTTSPLNKILNEKVLEYLIPSNQKIANELITQYQMEDETKKNEWLSIHPIWTFVEKRMNSKNDKFKEAKTMQLKSIVTQIVADDLTREFIQTQVKIYVNSIFKKLFETGELEQLPTNYEYPLTIMTIGPPGSGKSTLIGRLSQYYKNNFELIKSKMSVLTADRLRAVLQELSNLGTDIKSYGCLTQHEAISIYDDILIQLADLRNQGKMIQAFFESVFVYDNHVHAALSNNGKFELYLTFTDVLKLIERNRARFEEKGKRYVPDDAILKGAQTVSDKLPGFIKDYQETNIRITICDTDKMKLDSPELYIPIAVFDLNKNKLLLVDIQSMLDFIKQSEININAKDISQIFPIPNNISLSALAVKFKKLYGQCEIHFIDYQEKTPLQSEKLELQAYAIYSAGNLTIRQPKIFSTIIQKTDGAREIFDVLATTNENENENQNEIDYSNVFSM